MVVMVVAVVPVVLVEVLRHVLHLGRFLCNVVDQQQLRLGGLMPTQNSRCIVGRLKHLVQASKDEEKQS